MTRAIGRLAALLLWLGIAACATPRPLLTAGDAAMPGRDLLVTLPAGTADPAAVFRVIAAEYRVELRAEWPIAALGVDCAVLRVADAAALAPMLARLAADVRLESVQRLQLFETSSPGGEDPLRPLQAGLRALNLDAAHALATGRGVRVALVDTGVAAMHEDLAGQVAVSRDLVGIGDAAPPAERHGTALAGVIAAVAGNRRGGAGVAPGATLLALRGCWEAAPGGPGRCSSFTLARALSAAIGARADVINLSLHGPADPLLARLLVAARDSGAIVVTAFAAEGEAAFPGDQPGVLAVSVADGAALPGRLRAPGLRVLTTVPGGYDFVSGSSVAAAHVSGLVALLREAVPGADAAAVRAALLRATSGTSVPDACIALAVFGHHCE